MEPNSFGKKLGIGVRVAGSIARDRVQEAAKRKETEPRSGTAQSSTTQTVARAVPETISRKAEQAAARGRNLGQGLGRGTRQFGRSFFRPVAHASGVLWLEITGCFFALFAAFFAQNVYRVRAQYAFGPEHRTFLLYCVLTVLFAYFSISSFVRARRRSRRNAAGN